VLLMIVMLMAGMSLLSATDTQTASSKVERQRETSFNLAEGAMNAQMFQLSRVWPGPNTTTPYPTWCTPTSASSTPCPSSPALTSAFAAVDTPGATWMTTVRDDGQAPLDTFYDDAALANQPSYDQNGNGRVWVRAQATAGGQTRTIVALVKRQLQQEDVVHASVSAGRLSIGPMGQTAFINGGGAVMVRCAVTATDPTDCLGHDLTTGNPNDKAKLLQLLQTQIPNATPLDGTPVPEGMSAEARARERQFAIENGTWYATCPPASTLKTFKNTDVVWIESGNCTIDQAGRYDVGVLILRSGTLTIDKNGADLSGLVYAVNAANLNQAMVTVKNGGIHGGVLVDGNGWVVIGANGGQIEYDSNVFREVKSYGSAGVIQNTWREVKGVIAPPAS
jgi:hypothetical protein